MNELPSDTVTNYPKCLSYENIQKNQIKFQNKDFKKNPKLISSLCDSQSLYFEILKIINI